MYRIKLGYSVMNSHSMRLPTTAVRDNARSETLRKSLAIRSYRAARAPSRASSPMSSMITQKIGRASTNPEIGVLLRHEPYEDSVVQRSIAGIDRGPRWGSRRSHGQTLGFIVHVCRRLRRR